MSDLEEATAFFTDVFGCRTLYTMGPFQGSNGPFMRTYANSDVRSVVHHVRVLRSPFLNVELFQATSPRQRPLWPDLYDVGGWALTARVDDLDAAVEHLQARDDVYVLDAGHCMTGWGFHFALTAGPGDDQRWNPTGPTGPVAPGAVPGFRGFESLQVTVADLDEATELLTGVLGFAALGDTVPPRTQANVDARATPSRSRAFRSPYLDVDLVECPSYPGQSRVWPAMFDVGGWHLAFYVDDVDAAVADLEATDVHILGPKKPAYLYEAGEDAYTVHCLAPFGLLFELVTYPHGRYREAEHAGTAWHPSTHRTLGSDRSPR